MDASVAPELNTFSVAIDQDGIAIVLFDVPDRSMNTLTAAAMDDLDRIVGIIGHTAAIRGAILASGKANGFCAGADLGELAVTAGGRATGSAAVAALAATSRLSLALRRLETVGKPVVAALEGIALGGGLELALATHRRIASRATQIGLPEVTIGLLPGGGGTQRVTRLAGVAKALELMLTGTPIHAEAALACGLLDELVDPGATVAAGRRWILGGGAGVQPWDVKGYTMPDGPYTAAGSELFIAAAADVRSRHGGNYPARSNILRCVYEGFGLPMEAALRVESRLFLLTQQSPQAAAMIRSNFISRQALAKGAARPHGVPAGTIGKAAVLGAGMMGAGIAYVQARTGIQTVLIDRSQAAADRGRDYSRAITDKAVAKGRMTPAAAEALLGRIHATTDYAAIAGADLVVEAVFEDRALKADVSRRAEAMLAPDAVLASNTSTLPIGGLAEAVVRPENFIGIHFFSPVDRMELVEIIVGARTSQATLAKAIDYCRMLKKTPIVVNDHRGFYTSRVFETYLFEGLEMLIEGIAPAIIENAGRMTGMPRGPLELLDDVAIDLENTVCQQRRADLGRAEPVDGPERLIATLAAAGRLGRKNGRGMYDYPAGEAKRLWTGLADLHPVRRPRVDREELETLKDRLLYRQAIEAARCLDENVIMAARDADVGAILGWGFAPWTGGPISLIDGVGLGPFIGSCEGFAVQHGQRFKPPALLHRMRDAGQTFYPPPRAFAAA